MVVFSNRRLGPSAELLVSDEVARTMLDRTAHAARPFAEARWELELVLWLDRRAMLIESTSPAFSASPAFTASPSAGLAATRQSSRGGHVIDVNDIAWTPDHFGAQRAFIVGAIERAAAGTEHPLAYDRWRRLIEAHPAESVQVGRRWSWQPTA
jgi:hypothetical protein